MPQLLQIVLPTPWPVGPVQIYCLDTEPFTLIDTGVRTPESLAGLETALDSIGRGLEDVRRIILTHHHGDHLGQAQTIRAAAPDLEVCAHVDEVPLIEGFGTAQGEHDRETEALFREHGVAEEVLASQKAWLAERAASEPGLCEATAVDRRLVDGDLLAFKDLSLRVLHAPGHTAGHLLLYEETHGALVTGDTVMGGAVPSTALYYTGRDTDPADAAGRRPRFVGLPRYLETLRALRRMSLKQILPAHGGVIERPARAIEDAQLFYDVRIQRIERGLRTLAAMGQEVTAWDLWKALFAKADPVKEMRNRMLMVIGALETLEASGAVSAARRADGVLVHHHR